MADFQHASNRRKLSHNDWGRVRDFGRGRRSRLYEHSMGFQQGNIGHKASAELAEIMEDDELVWRLGFVESEKKRFKTLAERAKKYKSADPDDMSPILDGQSLHQACVKELKHGVCVHSFIDAD